MERKRALKKNNTVAELQQFKIACMRPKSASRRRQRATPSAKAL